MRCQFPLAALLALFAVSASAHICDAPTAWVIQYQVEDGEVKEANNLENTRPQEVFLTASEQIKYANDANKQMSGTCTVRKLEPVTACYKKFLSGTSNVIVNKYGFTVRASLNCPYPPFSLVKNVDFTSTGNAPKEILGFVSWQLAQLEQPALESMQVAL